MATNYGDLMYVYCELRRRGVLTAYPKSYRDENYMTLVIVAEDTRLYTTSIIITRTSRQCFRVLYNGHMDNYRNYHGAADRVCELLDQIEARRAALRAKWQRYHH